MKGFILALCLLAIILVSGCTGSSNYAAEREAAALEERASLEWIVSDTIELCRGTDYGDFGDDSACFAEEAAKIRKVKLGTGYIHTDFPDMDPMMRENMVYLVEAICNASEDPDYCYYYVAVMTENADFCSRVEDGTGCKMLSDEDYCKDEVKLSVPICLSIRAYAFSYINRTRADEICDYVHSRYNITQWEQVQGVLGEEYEYDGCDDIDYSDEEFESRSFRERFLVMYLYMWLSEYQTETVSVPVNR